jgi:hypothetical protein
MFSSNKRARPFFNYYCPSFFVALLALLQSTVCILAISSTKKIRIPKSYLGLGACIANTVLVSSLSVLTATTEKPAKESTLGFAACGI